MKKQLFISGKWVDAEMHAPLSPWSGKMLAEIPVALKTAVQGGKVYLGLYVK